MEGEPTVQKLAAPREPVAVVSSLDQWRRSLDQLETGHGPIALDVERASGFRYSQRAYLVQLYRRGAQNYLVDPIEISDLSEFTTRFGDVEWILHAARQDLSSLREVGIEPTTLFDTELGARLAGLPRVGLQGSVEDLLGWQLAKEHSAADWSTRPLPETWLNYAALDVEVLPDLRDAIWSTLVEAGKSDYAKEEFSALIVEGPAPQRTDPWRRLSGLHQLRNPRGMAIAKHLWQAREELAAERDIAPGRLIPDRSIVHVALKQPQSVQELLGLEGFHGRASRKEASRWWSAIEEGLRTDSPPPLRTPGESIPPPRAWPDKAPEASRRFILARDLITRQAERLNIPAENILTPEHLRKLCWSPVDPARPSAIDAQLEGYGARRWQRDLVVPLIVEAFSHAQAIDSAAPAP